MGASNSVLKETQKENELFKNMVPEQINEILKLITVIPFAIFPVCHVPSCKIKLLTFFLAVVMFPY